MPIPPLDERGFLPPGVHPCSLEEIRLRFGEFRRTDRRSHLFRQLERYMREARCAAIVRALVVDGSFVTGKDDPEDIDLVVVLPEALPSGVLNPSAYNTLSKRRIRKMYSFDAFVASDGTIEYRELIEFFAQVKAEPGLRKGVLRVEL
jgi:hypothetical protein